MTDSTSDWTDYRNNKSILDKDIENRQKQYINNKLDHTKDRWKTLRDIKNNNKSDPPRTIVHNNKVIYRLTDICNNANTFYIDIIKTIRHKFRPQSHEIYDVYLNLIPINRNQHPFSFQGTSDNEVQHGVKT